MPEPRLNTPRKTSFEGRRTLWPELIGHTVDFYLESRIFNSISITLIILVILYVPYDLFAGLYIAAISAFIFALFFSYQYYRSRFLGKGHSTIAFGVAGILILGVNYFANSGMQGSTDLIWPVYLLL